LGSFDFSDRREKADWRGEWSEFIEEVREIIKKAGYDSYELSDPKVIKSCCFDIIARKDARLLLIKVLLNVDNFLAEHAEELKAFANLLIGIPLVIGKHTKREEIPPGVLYERFGIPVLNTETFREWISHDEIVYAYVQRGGHFVKLDGSKLKQLRTELGLSTSEIAQKVGVSRRAIFAYEKGEMDAKREIVEKLKDILDSEDFIVHLEFPLRWKAPFLEEKSTIRPRSKLAKKIDECFTDLGFQLYWTKKAPFDALASVLEEKVSLTGVEEPREKSLEVRIDTVDKISKIVDRRGIFMVENERIIDRIDSLESVSVLTVEEAIKKKKDELEELLTEGDQ